MNQHFFQFPFGVNGDLAAVPQQSQVSGSVSYQSGYPFDYERDITNDPDALPIERTKMNQILNDVTTALQQYQVMGIPEWITATDNGGVSFPYAKFASVVFNGVCYVSQVANNTSTPGTDANWIVRPTTKNAPNLLFNSSAEFGIAGWASSNFAPITGGFGEGTFWENLAAIPNVTTMDTSQQITIGAGVALSIQAEIFAVGVTAGVGRVTVEAFTAANASLGIVASATAVNGQGWTFHSGSGTTPANTAYVLVHRVADTNPIVSINGLGFRRIKLEVGTLPSIYSREADATQVGQSMSRVQGLRGTNGATPATQMTWTVSAVTLRNPITGGTNTVVNPATLTTDISVLSPAANGRDQAAAFAPSTWIHFYYIYNPSTGTLATIASLALPTVGPTLPAGYTYWAYASTVYFGPTSALALVEVSGQDVSYQSFQNCLTGGISTTPVSVSVSTIVPPNALSFAIAVIQLIITSPANSGYGIRLNLAYVSGSTAYTLGFNGFSTVINNYVQGDMGTEMANVGQQFFYFLSNVLGTAVGANLGITDYSVANGDS